MPTRSGDHEQRSWPADSIATGRCSLLRLDCRKLRSAGPAGPTRTYCSHKHALSKLSRVRWPTRSTRRRHCPSSTWCSAVSKASLRRVGNSVSTGHSDKHMRRLPAHTHTCHAQPRSDIRIDLQSNRSSYRSVCMGARACMCAHAAWGSAPWVATNLVEVTLLWWACLPSTS